MKGMNTMANLKKEAYERKKLYAEKRNRENSTVETLTEEQHNTLAWLCEIRHNIHVSGDAMFNTESSEYSYWDYLDMNGERGEINNALGEVELPLIEWNGLGEDTPNSSDYTYVLTEEDRIEWENKAEAANLPYGGYTLWIEEGEEYQYFLEDKEKINDIIEKYLRNIDRQHGTNYCPTGLTRLY